MNGELYAGLSKIYQEFSSLRNLSGEVDFCVNVNNKGYLGFRSIGSNHVSPIAKRLFDGGGHANAAGGSLPGAGKEEDLEVWVAKFLEVIQGKEESL